jgi:hypothetical protein
MGAERGRDRPAGGPRTGRVEHTPDGQRDSHCRRARARSLDRCLITFPNHPSRRATQALVPRSIDENPVFNRRTRPSLDSRPFFMETTIGGF